MKAESRSTRMKAILQVTIVIFLHLIIIYLLGMKTGKLEVEVVKQMFIMYAAPIILLNVSCKIALKTQKLRYNISWLVISIVPSTRILFYLKELQGKESRGSGVVDLRFFDMKPDFDQISLIYFFPIIYLGIQLVLIFLLLIMIVTKEKSIAD
ncbi:MULTISPECIES: hypothetical protein [Paenibacillus]|uniref:Uncharacterized protein n=2 Tax=Paenibacillus TaxID=44249 RepID=A0A1R0XB86_9BACL|nr:MULTISPECIES: hypothetical protein [Paenibacillus]AIQ73552.1 hypothetical protein PODO_09975 [Paenibacillus odorifer]ETT64294.1 hypothetical protein C171_08567 [Paenibacillus sp. FSL H8-237]OMD13509.1 hypothetical protein BJP50_23935 [Paenibacillus odorifer]OMD18251.1 hypothetical protein BJP47_15570 [Paenibacillus odorifer]OMD23852.1 hypothetical protein BJP48_06320 [Paenibacillus odorifer]